jgi:hypothetical protein
MSEDVFKEVKIEEATLSAFWTAPIGTSAIVIIDVPQKTTSVELPKGSGKKQSRLFFRIITSDGKIGTFTVRYLDKVTNASLLGQLVELKKQGKLVKGTVIELNRVGSGQASRYHIKYIKKVDEDKVDAKVKEIEAKQKETKPAEKTKDVTDLFK